MEWLGIIPVGYPAVDIISGSSSEGALYLELEVGSTKAKKPALASASRSSVTSAKSRFIAAVVYDFSATKASMTRTDLQGITGLIEEYPRGDFIPLRAG